MRLITLERFAYIPNICTLGRVTVGEQHWFSVECPWLDNKPFKSCIPEGVYSVQAYSSEKYPDAYTVVDVPGRTHIVWHPANWVRHPRTNKQLLHGCIGLGKSLFAHSYGVKTSVGATEEFNATLDKYTDWVLQVIPRSKI